MATSGTKTFSLSIADAIEEAYELAGLEVKTGYDAETARRSLNIMFADWSNRGVNLWTIEQVSLDLVSGTSSYTLNSYDLDIVSAVIRQVASNGTQTDLQITNIGRTEYLNIPNKASTGRPTQYFIDRQTTPVLKVWPTPDSAATYKFVSYRIQRIDDVSASAQDPEVPSRFMPCMASGLAYYIALKKNPEKATLLKAQYEQDFKLASEEDRNRASVMLTPTRSNY
jgi:hypothetical protein|tara:strand:+ start:12612 stop:13289 length:678 start_codon:yes stop_codon:yes gene_type:complete